MSLSRPMAIHNSMDGFAYLCVSQHQFMLHHPTATMGLHASAFCADELASGAGAMVSQAATRCAWCGREEQAELDAAWRAMMGGMEAGSRRAPSHSTTHPPVSTSPSIHQQGSSKEPDPTWKGGRHVRPARLPPAPTPL